VTSWDPATLACFVPNEQPFVAGFLDVHFFPTPDRKLSSGIVIENERLSPLAREQLYWHPTFAAIRRPAPLPARKFSVLRSDGQFFTSGDTQRIGILRCVLAEDTSPLQHRRQTFSLCNAAPATSGLCRGGAPLLQEGKQIRVDLLRVGRGHAVWKALVGLECAIPQQLCREWSRIGERHDLIVSFLLSGQEIIRVASRLHLDWAKAAIGSGGIVWR